MPENNNDVEEIDLREENSVVPGTGPRAGGLRMQNFQNISNQRAVSREDRVTVLNSDHLSTIERELPS